MENKRSIEANIRNIAEAEAIGWTLNGPALKEHNGYECEFRSYTCDKGHIIDSDKKNVRFKTATCRLCQDDRYSTAAKNMGFIYNGTALEKNNGRKTSFRSYSCSNGHTFDHRPQQVKKGVAVCHSCPSKKTLKFIEEAKVAGFTLNGPALEKHKGNEISFRSYSCNRGHTMDLDVFRVRRGAKCPLCPMPLSDYTIGVVSTHIEEAMAIGWRINGPALEEHQDSTLSYRSYTCFKGHVRDATTGSVRKGHIRCQECDATSHSLPSTVYLMEINTPFHNLDNHLKLGFAKDIAARASQYGLPEGSTWGVVSTISTDTGTEAHAIENLIGKTFAKYRLSPTEGKDRGHSVSGYTECYRLGAKDQMITHFNELNKLQKRNIAK